MHTHTNQRWKISATIKQAISIKLASLVPKSPECYRDVNLILWSCLNGRLFFLFFLRELDFANVYMAWPSCFPMSKPPAQYNVRVTGLSLSDCSSCILLLGRTQLSVWSLANDCIYTANFLQSMSCLFGRPSSHSKEQTVGKYPHWPTSETAGGDFQH